MNVFVTGTTGALGSWIAAKLLSEGHAVTALARGIASRSAQVRVERALALTGYCYWADCLRILDADLSSLGELNRSFDLIIHCAACTAFHESRALQSRHTNVEGLQQVLKLATRSNARLVHVSTAYVCGDRTGIVLESELDVGQRFANTYERTKCEAEQLVHRWTSDTGLDATILRPGIVLGDWNTGRSVRFNTLYHLMATLDASTTRNDQRSLRLVGQGGVTKNITSVDDFAETAFELIRQGCTGVYHLTHPAPVTMDDLRDIFNELFEVDIEYVTSEAFAAGRPTPLERLCTHVMAPYRPYMCHAEPPFDRQRLTNALPPRFRSPRPINADYFRRLLAFGRQAAWAGQSDSNLELPGPTINSVDAYFTDFLPQQLHKSLLPSLKSYSAQFAICIDDPQPRPWQLRLQQGVLTSIDRGGHSPQCTFGLDSHTFLDIAAGAITPQRAFFAGKVKISGDIETGLKLATLLGKFFADHPFQAKVVMN